MVIPGHGTERVSTLRLWKAAAPAHIDLNAFNTGDYARAAEFKNEFENISWVLYPNDSTPAGRELRLKQEYFFTARVDPGHPGRATWPNTARWPIWPTRWPSTSTTRIRPSAWPS